MRQAGDRDGIDPHAMFALCSGVHPLPFHLDHRLSDWPMCRLELRCACGRSAFVPTSMLRRMHGDRTFRRVLTSLRCSACGALPAPIYLLAEEHREHCWGAPPGWAIELVGKPSGGRGT